MQIKQCKIISLQIDNLHILYTFLAQLVALFVLFLGILVLLAIF